MRYDNITPAKFLSRPNRFIAQVEVDGREETVHVKNTGRCRELLVPGATVWLTQSANPARKTRYDLVAVDKGGLLINMDAQAPNRVFAEWAQGGHLVDGLTLLRPETTWGSSRFDFYWEAGERRGFVEVKGCTLETGGLALFPDAPTQRGVKHLRELIAAHEAGYEAAVCFVIQMKGMRQFRPNDATHPEFGAALRQAAQAGVGVLAVDCQVTPDSLTMDAPVPVELSMQGETG
jgi:sugar fermentation stimulation protein A